MGSRDGYGAHTERATDTPSTTWYFAEGSQGFFSTFLLLANPNDLTSDGHGRLSARRRAEGDADLRRAARCRAARSMRAAIAALVNRSFGMVVTFTQPGLAERAMYFGADPLWRGGHASAGVRAPSTTAFVAEGATGPFFETFILIANPQPDDVERGADVRAAGRYADRDVADGPRIEPAHAQHRDARSGAGERGGRDQHHGVGCRSSSSARSTGRIRRRSGTRRTAARRCRRPARSGASRRAAWAARRTIRPTSCSRIRTRRRTRTSRITFLRESGAPFTKTFTVPATQRFNVRSGPGTDVPELVDERFGALITSDQPIAVERAMYSDAGGQSWAAGTSANATPVP